jgi:hypothetical protein
MYLIRISYTFCVQRNNIIGFTLILFILLYLLARSEIIFNSSSTPRKKVWTSLVQPEGMPTAYGALKNVLSNRTIFP